MSDTDSFIDEVTDEVRQDKLFATFRKYGWIGIALVIAIVGGAAINEYRAAQARFAAEERGDALLAAMDAETSQARMAALEALEIDGESAAVLQLLRGAEVDDPVGADAALASLMDDPDAPALYRDLAALKRVSLQGGTLPPTTRMEMMEPLAIAGGTFRTLAEEQLALAELEMGNTEGALTRLNALLDDAETTEGLRTRAEQLIVALGGAPGEADTASE